MSGALVLNASYEPLGIVAVRRAVCLVLAEKADIIAHDRIPVCSVSRSVPRPLVVRLRYMVKVPFRRHLALSRRAVFARDDHRCQYCGQPADSIDHVLPRSRGGEHIWENVAAACRRCNTHKRDRTPEEAGMRLARPCVAPRSTGWVSVSASRVPDAWKPFLTTYSSLAS
jgi:5-methylcytosine-specific restriction endonuclease McrA